MVYDSPSVPSLATLRGAIRGVLLGLPLVGDSKGPPKLKDEDPPKPQVGVESGETIRDKQTLI